MTTPETQRRLQQQGNDIEALYQLATRIDRTVTTGFAKVDERFARVDEQLTAVDERLTAHDGRFDSLDQRLTTHDNRFDSLDSKLDAILARLGNRP